MFGAITATGLLLALMLAVPVRARRRRERAVLPPAPGPSPTAAWVAGGTLALATIALTLTSIASLLTGAELRAWGLLAHVSLSPLFLAGLVLFAKFSPPAGVSGATARAVLLTGLITAGAMVASMLPAFGYDALLDFRTLHRYGGLLFLMSCTTYVAGVVVPVRQ